MKIGLYGFTFSHENMGCQALTCSFLDILKGLLPDRKIDVVVFDFEKTLGDVPKLYPNMSFSLCNISLKDNFPELLQSIKECDFIFDETYGDGFSDIYFTKSVFKNVLIKNIMSRLNQHYILTPQTYGPFAHKSLERLASSAIKQAKRVYSRDGISSEYARSLSKREVVTAMDLAFALTYKAQAKRPAPCLGINVSGLLWQGGFNGNVNQFGLKTDYQEYCRSVIQYGLDNGFEVYLIPHVTASADKTRAIPDGDYPACVALSKEFKKAILAPCFSTPQEAKSYIAGMSCFIGARMHSTIAAFSSGVATIPFAYSRKFKGLYEGLGYPYFVDGSVLSTAAAIAKTTEFIVKRDELALVQKKSLVTVKEKLGFFKHDLALEMGVDDGK